MKKTIAAPGASTAWPASKQEEGSHRSTKTRTAPRTSPSGRLIPAADWDSFHPWPPLGGLRHLIFNAKQNGFDVVIRRVGRRVLIDEAAFFAWVEQHGRAG